MFKQQIGEGTEKRFDSHPQIIEDLKAKARKLGLWNMFLPKNHFKEGAGFSNLEYGLMAEYLGKSFTASEATNCAAPDTGNMEVFAKYGTDEQKKKWLVPLLNGEIRSAFLMTEPQVASSDATNIELDIKRDGDYYVLNGQVRTHCPKHAQAWPPNMDNGRSPPLSSLLCPPSLSCTLYIDFFFFYRNGGPAAPATAAAKSTLSSARPTRTTPTSTSSSRSCWCQPTPLASPSSACFR